MSWNGYFSYAGTEIINVARMRAYRENLNLAWFRPGYEDSQFLGTMRDEIYGSPLLDAPWRDQDNPDSIDFYGVYPVNVQGLDDSTRTAEVTESILDGGVVGRLRNSTRSIVFECALLAGSECGADYGVEWLKKILNGANCEPNSLSNCAGNRLDFYNCAPTYSLDGITPDTQQNQIVRARWDGGYWVAGVDVSVDTPLLDGGTPSTTFTEFWDGGTPLTTGGVLSPPYSPPFEPEDLPTIPWTPQECLIEFERHLRNVAFIDGPTITKKRQMTSGDWMVMVTFTAVAGDPYRFGTPINIVSNFLGPGFIWGADVGMFDDSGEEITDTACLPVTWEPLVDPLCPVVQAPPSVPDAGMNCFDVPEDWVRRWFTVNADQIPEWGDVVPLLQVEALFADVRNLRVRFYSDDGSHVITDTCDPLMDLVVTYIPFDYTLIVDAESRTVFAADAFGNLRRADSLVRASDGTPFEWPVISCGDGLIVAVDVPEDSEDLPAVSLSLASRGA